MATQGPNAPQAAANDASLGGTKDWGTLLNVQSQDSSYSGCSLTPNQVSKLHKTSVYQFSVPNDAGPVEVTFRVRRKKFAGLGVTKDHHVRLVLAGVVQSADHSLSSPWPNGDADVSYVFSGLTSADVNDPGFGFALACKNYGMGDAPGSVNPVIDLIEATASW